jgi:alkaline phosphatase D
MTHQPLTIRLAVVRGSWLAALLCFAALFVGRDASGEPDRETAEEQGPFQATGFKVGEVTDTGAIVWTRLTLRPVRNPSNGPMVLFRYKDEGEWVPYRHTPAHRAVVGVRYPEGVTVADLADAVPGTAGETRVRYRPQGTDAWQQTDWQAVDPSRDFARQFLLTGLTPDTRYEVCVDARAAESVKRLGQSLDGTFQTAPVADDTGRVVFTVSTCQGYWSQDCPTGYKIYGAMLDLEPNFFVHTGDVVYYDRIAKTEELARYLWQATYSLPSNIRFHRQVSSYFMKDDHDTWQDDCWPGMKSDKMYQFTFEQGLRIFPEQVPMGDSTYRTRRWGKDLQVWFVEGRDFRSPNTMPDGPEKTIWGEQQKAWFKDSVQRSDATFRILFSPTPLIGPDRKNKRDNHSNESFRHEGDELRRFLAEHNMVVINGDRHWQYMSVHPETGVREYSCGSVSDLHAGGWSDDQFIPEYHRFLKVAGGFLSATSERIDGQPTLTFRFHDVQGNVRFEDQLTGKAAAR